MTETTSSIALPATLSSAASPIRGATNLDLRPAEQSDLPFLRGLYGDLRAEELASTGWPDAAVRAFLDQQFALQHRHYRATHPGADFLIVTLPLPPRSPTDIGRLYLDRTAPRWRLIDIGLVAAWRGAGLGQTLLEWIQESATREGAEAVDLSVAYDNRRAQALYTRLRFCRGQLDGAHYPMTWRVS